MISSPTKSLTSDDSDNRSSRNSQATVADNEISFMRVCTEKRRYGSNIIIYC